MTTEQIIRKAFDLYAERTGDREADTPDDWDAMAVEFAAKIDEGASIPEPDMRGDVVERLARDVSKIVFAHTTFTGGFEYADVAATKEIVAAIDAACPRHE